LQAENPGHEYFWIVGTDALVGMPTWHEFAELIQLIKIVAVNRNGVLQPKVEFTYHFVQIPEIDISSTEIRKRVKENLPIKYLVPTNVEKFINESGIYSK
jgi:nicotinate-nucleotide adenylyltransferase